MSTLLLLAAAVLAPGQQMGPLEASNAIVDRGEVKAGMPLAQSFTLTNRGQANIAITGLNPGCGCLRPQIDSKILQPGQSTEVHVEINTIAQNNGPNTWKMTVGYTYDRQTGAQAGELDLQVKAKVIREINVEPVSLSLTIDREATHPITVTDRRARPLTITAAQCESKHVKLQLGPVAKNGWGQQVQQVQVTVLESCPPGQFTEPLILVTNDPEYRELRVPLMVMRRVPGLAAAVPEQVHLRLAKGQKTATELVRLRTSDDKKVVVEKIEADHPAIRFKWAEGPGNMATVRLVVDLEEPLASGLGNVKIYLAEPKQDVIQIPVSWLVP